MDRSESKALIEEIEGLIENGEKEQALDVLDAANWRKVHNVNTLVTVAGLYEELEHIDDAKELLLIAHERSPIGRIILYHLALICIKRKELNEAEKYFEDFVEIAPHDSMKYVIRYQLSKARGADIYTLIGILEDFKEYDFREDWAFELAYLYHKSGQSEKCTDLCDEIVLWFGDGPYVEKALELKVLYAPLTEAQESKFRELRANKKGGTLIKANEMLESGEIIRHDIEIPSVEMDPDRFNTINLQAEIKKNIEEIMAATEEKDVSENLGNIKELVGDFPYLQATDVEEANYEKQKAAEKKIDEELKNKFHGFLEEEHDGQISLLVPEEKPQAEQQVEGQMTIEDVMSEWEKTKKAARAALDEAAEEKLKSQKQLALQEANEIMNRLVDVIPRIDAGETIQDISREEYMPDIDEPVEDVKVEAEPEPEKDEVPSEPNEPNTAEGADEPKVAEEAGEPEETAEPVSEEVESEEETGKTEFAAGLAAGAGLSLPKVDVNAEHILGGETAAPTSVAEEAAKVAKEWEPPHLSEEEIKKSKILKNEAEPKVDVDDEPKAEVNPEPKAEVDAEQEASRIMEGINNMLQRQIDEMYKEEADKEDALKEDVVKEEAVKEEETPEKPVIEVPIEVVPTEEPQAEELPKEEPVSENVVPDGDTIRLPRINIDEVIKDSEPISVAVEEIEREAIAESLNEDVITAAVADEIPRDTLTDEEKVQFSYFVPVSGMEQRICRVLEGAKEHLQNPGSHRGHIIIEGIPGSGKTMLATSLIKVLQAQINAPGTNVGKIDGDKLNDKDLNTLFRKVRGGALIIERAGEVTAETAVSMSLLMENDNDNTLIIMEDTKKGVKKLLTACPELGKKFTERMEIPLFTIDELVNFAKAYVKDWDCVMDEMAVLALYNRINTIQAFDHATSLSDVRDILDEAIHKADRGGLLSHLGNKKYDDDGNLIIHEKDLQE